MFELHNNDDAPYRALLLLSWYIYAAGLYTGRNLFLPMSISSSKEMDRISRQYPPKCYPCHESKIAPNATLMIVHKGNNQNQTQAPSTTPSTTPKTRPVSHHSLLDSPLSSLPHHKLRVLPNLLAPPLHNLYWFPPKSDECSKDTSTRDSSADFHALAESC